MRHLVRIVAVVAALFISQITFAQVGTNGDDRSEEGRPVKEYNLTIEQKEMTLGGASAKAMTINGRIPGPVLRVYNGRGASEKTFDIQNNDFGWGEPPLFGHAPQHGVPGPFP